MSLRERAVSAAVWTAVRQWGGHASTLVVLVALARLLEPDAFGLVAYIGVYLGLAQLLSVAGFTQAIVQRQEIEPEHLDTAFWTNVAIAALLAGALIAGAEPVAGLLERPELAPLLRWLPAVLVLEAMSATHVAILRRRLDFKPIALRTLAANTAGGILGVTMAVLGYGVWSLVGQQLFAAAVGVVVLWNSSGWRPRALWSRRHAGDLVSFGSSVLGLNLLRFSMERADRFIIGAFLGPAALGIYVIGARAVRLATDLLSQTLRSVSLPVFSKMQRDVLRMRRALGSAAEINAFVTAPVYFALAALAPLIVPLVFGPQWDESVVVLQILVIFGLARSVQMLNAPVLMAMGKPSWVLVINLTQALVAVPALIVGMKLWGVSGVAAAVALRAVFELPLFLLAARRLLGAPLVELLAPYAFPVAVSAVLGAGAFWFREAFSGSIHPWVLLLGILGMGALLYLVAVRTLAPRLFQNVLDLLYAALPGSLRSRFARPAP